MSKPVVITADSTCDLSQELKERFAIHTLPLTILLGEQSYLDGVDFTTEDIYRRYREDGTLPKTAAPGIQQLTDFFTQCFYGFIRTCCRVCCNVRLDVGCNNRIVIESLSCNTAFFRNPVNGYLVVSDLLNGIGLFLHHRCKHFINLRQMFHSRGY